MGDTLTFSTDTSTCFALGVDFEASMPPYYGNSTENIAANDVAGFEAAGTSDLHPAFLDLSKISSGPDEMPALDVDNLSPWAAVTRQVGRRRTPSDNSASSCATFSTMDSRSSSGSSIARPNHDAEQTDCTYQNANSTARASKRSKLPAKFHCTFCSKSFTRAYNLRSHLRTHAHGRPFACKFCGEPFTRQHDHRQHERLHHEEECLCKGKTQLNVEWGCGRTFKNLHAFVKHLRSETGRACIGALVIEEQSFNAGIRLGVSRTGKSKPYSHNYSRDTEVFPASLVALYPGLATQPWLAASRADVVFVNDYDDDETERSGRSSDSSCDTFSSLSSLSSNEFNMEKSSSHGGATALTNILASSNSTDENSARDTILFSYDNCENQGVQENNKGLHLDHETFGLGTMYEHDFHYYTGDLNLQDDYYNFGLNYYGHDNWIDNRYGELEINNVPTPSVRSDTAVGSIRNHSNSLPAAEVEQAYRSVDNGTLIFGGEKTTITEGNKNEVSAPQNQLVGDDQFAQLSPAMDVLLPVAGTIGKASPYSSQSQDSGSDTLFEDETDMSSDEYTDSLSPSPSIVHISDLGAPKCLLIIEVLRSFWDIYNKDYAEIISQCIYIFSTLNGFGSGTVRQRGSSSGGDSAAPICPSGETSSPSSGAAGSKRKICGSDRRSDNDDEDSMEPSQGLVRMPSVKLPIFRYACPFRKHNPRKYNMHHYKSCALGAFGSIARVKEHLYRRHMAPVQCVRCWLFFKDQENLNVHISASVICDRRDGVAAEGITPAMEKRLRSRKKASAGQSDNDRWRDIYRMLFPGVIEEEVPSPFYETVQDDAAQAFASLVPLEEFMRQEVPQVFTNRLQTEIDNMDLRDSGLLDDPVRLRESFIARMRSLISEAQDAAIDSYRQRLHANSVQTNQLMTPAPSLSSSGLVAISSSQSSRTALDQYHDIFQTRQSQPAATQWSQNLQPVNLVAADDALQEYLANQIPEDPGVASLESGNTLWPDIYQDFNPSTDM